MSLLTLEAVEKRYSGPSRQRIVLRDVTLEIETGELVVVWGLKGSGRSTLLRVAAGIEAPDSGSVRFEGRDVTEHGDDLLGGAVGYCERTFRCAEGQDVLDQVTVGLLARGVAPRRARSRAQRALQRAGAEHYATQPLGWLDAAESVRVAIARTLALEPSLLVIDEPTRGVDLLERDGILALLRSLADAGIAILASAGESTGLAGADRALVLSEGELRGAPTAELATVLPLRRPAGWRATA
ncbi:MAG TPA: ATP-binding cassette domain-containing protein [Solirubrobacteraceae bacterium]|jgi:ABC-type multidrug transport system ATPase subunit|nr:ATP-binding cassette domain-containing protein [Solirubrobacteraceae bacterium]